MAVATPPPTREIPHAGVIDDARARQRRRRGRIAAVVALGVLLAGGVAIYGGGSGGGHTNDPGPAGASWSSTSIGHGIGVSYPRGWHLLEPPLTSLRYPYDRVLLTSYPARAGGDCSPTRAENALPSGGALVYLLEYSAAPSGVFGGEPVGASFAPQSAGFRLEHRDLANYECWTVPGYMMRFRVAGRLFQAHVSFGAGATARIRLQALQILSRLRVRGSS